MTHRPPDTVLRAWEVDDLVPLVGGQGAAFRAGDLVLKPVSEPSRASWLADVLDALAPDPAIRIARPAASIDGDWVVNGWSAWHWLDGQAWSGSLQELLEASAQFHRVVATVGWSPMMVGHDRWAIADRVAWGEEHRALPPALERLAAARTPLRLPSQLIHGDLRGNVLAHPATPPAVIDISPFWRPAAAADAIVVVDELLWGSGDETLDTDALGPHAHQLLIRAVLFRALSDPDPTDIEPYVRLAEVLLTSVSMPEAVERSTEASAPRGWRRSRRARRT
jgi:uncharacterized protein (TIGR02569 family)